MLQTLSGNENDRHHDKDIITSPVTANNLELKRGNLLLEKIEAVVA
jgi:hypothetical protein